MLVVLRVAEGRYRLVTYELRRDLPRPLGTSLTTRVSGRA